MPLYVFRCAGGHDFEMLIPMSGDAPDCPACGESSRKLPTTFGYHSGAARPRKPQPTFNPTDVWREAFAGRPDRLRREVEFREKLARTGKRESDDIPSPDRNLTGGVVLG